MKGVIKVEFILGVVIFAILIFYIAFQINTSFVGINIDTNLDMLKSESYSVLTILSTDETEGLAYSKNVLSFDKIKQWDDNRGSNNNCINLDEFNLGGYRLNIYHEDYNEPILFCGYIGLSTLRTNVIKHVKIYDESTNTIRNGNMTMEMW